MPGLLIHREPSVPPLQHTLKRTALADRPTNAGHAIDAKRSRNAPVEHLAYASNSWPDCITATAVSHTIKDMIDEVAVEAILGLRKTDGGMVSILEKEQRQETVNQNRRVMLELLNVYVLLIASLVSEPLPVL